MAGQLAIVEGPDTPPAGGLSIVEGPEGHEQTGPTSTAKDRSLARRKAVESRRQAGQEPVLEALEGFGGEALHRVQQIASPIRKLFGMAPAVPLQPTTTAGKVGRTAEQVGEFFVPEAVAGKAVGALKAGRAATTAVKAGLTGLGTAAVAKAQGDERPVLAGAVGAAGPLLELGPAAVKGLRSAAGRSLAKFFGESELTPMAKRQAIQDMVPAALDAGIPASWDQWIRQARTSTSATGEKLATTVKGGAGAAWTSIQPVRQALEEYADRVGRIVQKDISPAGVELAKHTVTVKNQAAVTAANNLTKRLTDIEGEYGTDRVPARVLHDLKGTWNRIAKWARTPGATARDFVMTERAEAARTGAKAIADVLDQKAPKISDLDHAYHVAKDLQHAVVKAALEATGRSTTAADEVATKIVSGVRRFRLIGTSSLATVGATAGYRREGLTGAVEGAFVGGLAGSMLEKAIQSPAWQLRTPRTLMALADAIERGDTTKIKTLVLPFLAKSAAGSTKEQTSPDRSPGNVTLDKAISSLTGLEKARTIGADKKAEFGRELSQNMQLGEMPMPDLEDIKVLEFLPKALPKLSQVAKQVLRRSDNLGFDTVGQAMAAIRQAPDWAERWEVSTAERSILEKWRTADLLAHPPQQSIWQEFAAIIRAKTAEERTAAINAARHGAELARKTFRVIPKEQ